MKVMFCLLNTSKICYYGVLQEESMNIFNNVFFNDKNPSFICNKLDKINYLFQEL